MVVGSIAVSFHTSHVLITSPLYPLASHYSSMMEAEGVTELLRALAAHPNTHSDIKGLTDSILRMVEQHQSHSGNQTGPRNL